MTNHAEVRYLDSGGRELVAAGNLYRMHPRYLFSCNLTCFFRHASYPPLCVQFCLHGVCDPDPEYQRRLDFSKERKSAFRSCLRVDVPLLIGLLGVLFFKIVLFFYLAQPYHGNRRVPDIVYKDEHVLYAYDVKFMGDSQSFIQQLEKLRPKHRLQENPIHPIGIDQLFPCH